MVKRRAPYEEGVGCVGLSFLRVTRTVGGSFETCDSDIDRPGISLDVCDMVNELALGD